MEQIYPLSMEGCVPHIGRTVCAVMHDGSYVYGRLANVTADGIFLDGNVQGPGVVSARHAGQAKEKIGQNLQKAQTKAFFNPFFFPFASLAFLFAFPFFFI